MTALVEEGRFRGEPALTLASGPLTATFLPGLGMTGVSLRYEDSEHLALPGGLPALRRGATLGLPLLAPWANRLASRRYGAAGVTVDLSGLQLNTDDNGLPIHGLLVGQPGWQVTSQRARGETARLGAAIDVDAPAFPFPHRIELTIRVRAPALRVETRIRPMGRRAVPIAFGWHPYLQLDSSPRREWSLRLPAREHLALDRLGIPTGTRSREPAEDALLGRRLFDDLYALGRDRRLSLEAPGGARVELHPDASYGFAQVWVPRGRRFAALEPMAAPTNALTDGRARLVRPGATFTAGFDLVLSGQT